MALFGKIKLGKTLLNGVKRALKINVSEQTPDEEINDGVAKAIKILARLIAAVVLYKLFPDVWEGIFQLVIGG